jgi:hypothetical protein
MIQNIPLIQKAEKNDINASIIAIKRAFQSLLGGSDSGADLSPFVKKSDVVDEVESGNMNPVTSNAVMLFFNTIYPVGFVYPQYPQQKSPNELWGNISTWQELDFGGAFFRSSGGNADEFDANIKAITTVSGNTITIANHGASAGTVIYDYTYNESRVVSSVSGNVITLNSQFSHTDLRNVLIGQSQATAKNGLWLNSASDKSGSANTTSGMSANSSHSHGFSYGGSAICVDTNGYDTRGGFADGNKWKNRNTRLSGIGSASVAHTHSIYLGSDDTETRPSNYTFKVWVRVS